MMADTNNSSNASGGGGPEVIPQWKKELIQRRKNLAKTIGAAATQVHDSASTVAAALTTPTTPRAGPGGNPFGSGQKDPSVVAPSVAESPTQPATATVEPSAASPTPALESNSNNSDSPASPTAAAATSSPVFSGPVFVGHSHSSPVNEHPAHQVLVKSPLGSTATNTASSATRGGPEVLLVGGTSAEKQPLHTQSHSNDGTESTSSSANSRSNHLHSSALSGSPKGGGGAPANSGPAGKYAAVVSTGVSGISASADCELTRPGPGETNSYSSEIGWKLKKNTSSASSSVGPNGGTTKMVAASAEEIIYEKNRFVGTAGTGETGAPGEVDTSEELKYGPGIVSKLRCRYLSLALRQCGNKQRPSLNSMRRATSLNNLLDEESEDLSEREQSIDGKDHSQDKSYQSGKIGRDPYSHQMYLQQQKAKTPDEYISTFQKSVQNSYTRSGRQTEKKNEYNRYNKQRGADSLKRARSVEALVRYDHKAWERDIQKENLYSSNDSNVIILDEICTNGTTANGNSNNNNGNSNGNCQSVAMNKPELIVDCVTIEEKIINGREKGDPKPKRLTSFIDADERPPPDVVRQTMKIFEANANRRGRPVARTNGAAGEVAAKVASFKSIISQEKPPITHPKPPLSPKKPNIIPRTTSPKSNGTTNTTATTVTAAAATTVAAVNTSNTASNGLKDKPPSLPKLDINAIHRNNNNNRETANNLKNSAAGSPVQSPPGLAAGLNQNNTSTPLSVRVEPPASYRLKYDSPALSPNTAAQHKVVSTTATTNTTTAANTTNRPESPPRFSAAAAANMQNNTNSTAHTFVDSPSIQALTSKLNNLNIATSTPTSTRSPTPSDPAAGGVVPPQVPPRNILQYVTSDEEDPDDPEEDRQREYSINSDHGSDSQVDDLELDDEPDTAKKVSRSAMENIAKAGVTTQFRFNGQPQNKSHLPSLGAASAVASAAATAAGGGGAKLLASKKLNVDDHLSSNSSSTSSSPITVPAAVVTQKPPVPLSRESLGSNGLKPISITNNNNNLGSVAANNNLNNLNSSNANSSVNSSGSKSVINAPGGNNTNGGTESAANVSASNVSSDVKTVNLTAREIEKNQINLEKSGEELISGGGGNVLVSKSNNNSDVGAGVGSAAGDFFMAKWGAPGGVAAAPLAASAAAPTAAATSNNNSTSNPLAGLMPAKKKVKAPPPPIEANTMVFNFSDRKEVPDYIENDGVILRPRPRELPKPGESGFVVLGDLTLETSTDPDDSWAMGPPSPCDVEFENANIVINGKSSMRNKTSRDNKFKIQFDDSLTSTFEYPSETSLLETTNGFNDTVVTDGPNGLGALLDNNSQPGGGGGGGGGGLPFGDNGLLSHKTNLLSSMPLGSAPFASYTPVKAAIDTNFELGVTRTPSPSSTASNSTASSVSSSITTNNNNDHHHQLPHHQQHHPNHHQHHLPHQHAHSQLGSNGTGGGVHHTQHQQHLNHQDRLNGTSDGSGLLLLNGEAGEPESIQYLKPASDEQTVNWSQGTRVTDLLF